MCQNFLVNQMNGVKSRGEGFRLKPPYALRVTFFLPYALLGLNILSMIILTLFGPGPFFGVSWGTGGGGGGGSIKSEKY